MISYLILVLIFCVVVGAIIGVFYQHVIGVVIISLLAAFGATAFFIFNMISKLLNPYNKEMSAQRDEISVLYQHTEAMNMELHGYLDEIKENYLSTVRALANAIDAKDKYTKGHCERVTEYSMKIGKKMGLRDAELTDLEFAALLHDIGKIGIPASIINKSTSLTDAEFEKIKMHPVIGYEILKEVKFLEKSVEILLQHHERIDGRGYPCRLKGQEINKCAQILAVADSYDAMISSRPYRKLNKIDALMEIAKNKGTQFSEEVADVFIDILRNEAEQK